MRRHPDQIALAALLFFIISGAALCALIWLCTGCAVTGNRDTDAEALDTYTATPAAGMANYSQAAPSPSTGSAATRLRYRHTTTGTKPPSFRQRVAGIFGNFSGAALVAIAIALVVAPGTVLAFALRRFLQIRAALRETVAGLRNAEAAGQTSAVLPHLSAAQSPRTKAIIASVKHDA